MRTTLSWKVALNRVPGSLARSIPHEPAMGFPVGAVCPFCSETSGFREQLQDRANNVRGTSQTVFHGIAAFIPSSLRQAELDWPTLTWHSFCTSSRKSQWNRT